VTPLVSVIIPTRNRAALTLQAIASVRSQTHRETEIIVVDDGSEDDTVETVGRLPDITFLSQPHRGSAAARTRGLGAAGGELVASLDSDDVWHPAFLERCVGALRAWDLDLVFANWVRDPPKPSYLDQQATKGKLAAYRGDVRDGWALLSPEQLRAMFLHACPAPSSSMVLRRASMPVGWNMEMAVGDDWYLVVEMALRRRSRAAFTLEPLWTKRMDGANVFEGRSPEDLIRRLYVHDIGLLRRDFAGDLTLRERVSLAREHLVWHSHLAYLRLRRRGSHAVPSPAGAEPRERP
jgi:glycosyltransferase involved in cell wall biosynthesis